VSYACGYLGLDINYFWGLTIAEFHLISLGAIKRIHEQQLSDLYNTRTIAYFSVAPHSKKMPPIEKFMPLPTDKEQSVRKEHEFAKLSETELAKIFRD